MIAFSTQAYAHLVDTRKELVAIREKSQALYAEATAKRAAAGLVDESEDDMSESGSEHDDACKTAAASNKDDDDDAAATAKEDAMDPQIPAEATVNGGNGGGEHDHARNTAAASANHDDDGATAKAKEDAIDPQNTAEAAVTSGNGGVGQCGDRENQDTPITTEPAQQTGGRGDSLCKVDVACDQVVQAQHPATDTSNPTAAGTGVGMKHDVQPAQQTGDIGDNLDVVTTESTDTSNPEAASTGMAQDMQPAEQKGGGGDVAPGKNAENQNLGGGVVVVALPDGGGGGFSDHAMQNTADTASLTAAKKDMEHDTKPAQQKGVGGDAEPASHAMQDTTDPINPAAASACKEQDTESTQQTGGRGDNLGVVAAHSSNPEAATTGMAQDMPPAEQKHGGGDVPGNNADADVLLDGDGGLMQPGDQAKQNTTNTSTPKAAGVGPQQETQPPAEQKGIIPNSDGDNGPQNNEGVASALDLEAALETLIDKEYGGDVADVAWQPPPTPTPSVEQAWLRYRLYDAIPGPPANGPITKDRSSSPPLCIILALKLFYTGTVNVTVL